MIRAPICAVVGHVDHGKTTLLDTIRGTATATREAGKITQAIGASIIPISHIIKKAGELIKGKNITVPGLLFIDTPGHAAFTGMRKRGGSLADIAILIVDINEGFKPQTREALEILKNYKTPFVVVANKIDLSPGYKKRNDNLLIDWQLQSTKTQEYLETKLYEIVGELAKQGMPAERFDRVEGFDKQISIIPVSAVTGHGLDTVLAILVGLAQRYLEKNLQTDISGPPKGTILEVTEDKGLGTTINAILYDGTIHVGDTIVLSAGNKPIVTKVRALFQPGSIDDIRDKKARFISIQSARAATGVKISAPNLERITAGTNFYGGDIDEAIKQITKQAQEIKLVSDNKGVVLKADNIGSLEAVMGLLREKNIPVRVAEIGPVTKKDVAQAQTHKEPYNVILAFNVPAEVSSSENVKIISADVIYKLVDDYYQYKEESERMIAGKELEGIIMPARIKVLKGCIFRQSSPLVCGVEVLIGELEKGAYLVNEKNPEQIIGQVKEIQDKGEALDKAIEGQKVAVSIPKAVAGKQISEEDVLWAQVKEEDFIRLKKHAKLLSPQQKNALREFAEVMRNKKPMWGV